MDKTLQILDITSTTVNLELYNITAINRNNDPYWVEFIAPYFKEIDVDIVVLPLTKIDKNKKWLINVDINSWNWESHSGNIFKDFHPDILNELLHGNAYIILNHQCESFTNSFLTTLYAKIKNIIPACKVIYMVAAADIERIHDNFIVQHNINDPITVWYTHHVYKRFNHDVDLSFFSYVPMQKTKKYLSLNRRGRDHRVMLTSLLSYKNLLGYGFVSLGIMPEESDAALQRLSNIEMREGFLKFKNQLPLQIDMIDLSINQFQANSLPIEFYQQSCFSLVSSTMALLSDEESVGFTEKEVKPILARHPFIIFNRPGVLKYMQNMGFLTFEPWFDESYDKEHDDIVRLEKIVNEVERLCKLSFAEWDIILDNMKPVLDHNYNRMANYTNEHCYFNSDLKKILYYAE